MILGIKQQVRLKNFSKISINKNILYYDETDKTIYFNMLYFDVMLY